jgi:peptide chain release factor 1
MEETMTAYEEWNSLETERLSLVNSSLQQFFYISELHYLSVLRKVEMDQSGDVDQELRNLIRADLREITVKQNLLEEKIIVLLLPRDPNDDRNVMLEIRAGTGGDEASIFAGDLVTIYRKYCEGEGWKVTQISDTQGEIGGYKTCVLQVTGDYVYSKLKYEVRRENLI